MSASDLPSGEELLAQEHFKVLLWLTPAELARIDPANARPFDEDECPLAMALRTTVSDPAMATEAILWPDCFASPSRDIAEVVAQQAGAFIWWVDHRDADEVVGICWRRDLEIAVAAASVRAARAHDRPPCEGDCGRLADVRLDDGRLLCGACGAEPAAREIALARAEWGAR